MKTKSIFAVTLLALATALSLSVRAAETDKASTTATSEAQAQKPAAKKQMKPHSHVEEKLGISPAPPEQTANPSNAANDRSKHYHPRDGK